MANQDHLDLLSQGVEGWNQWRQEQQDVQPDLSDANLTYYTNTDLSIANLSGANLSEANLRGLRLIKANFIGANLVGAKLFAANLSGANLSGADLADANLVGANLSNTIFNETRFANTILAAVDLSLVQGLETSIHLARSFADINTVIFPHDETTRKHFLRGVGFTDTAIDYLPSILTRTIQYHSLFLSYSHHDEAFIWQLYKDLQNKGVRCWFALEDMKIGDKIRLRIDEAIHLQDKLLLLLSEHAIASPWVEDEVEAALEKEQRQQREVLFPVRLDESVMQTSAGWAAKLRRSRHIGDFTRWKDHDAYQQAFERLLRDLKADPSKPTV